MIAHSGLGGGGEENFIQLFSLLITGAQLNAADFTGFLIIFPAGAHEIAANNALNGNHLSLADDQGTALEIFGVGFQLFAGGHISRKQMVGHILEKIEPEQRNLGEHFTFAGHSAGEHHVKSTQTVCGDEKKCIAQIVDITDFAAAQQGNTRQRGFDQSSSGIVTHGQTQALTEMISTRE